jgi:hypothetical protein
MSVLIVVEVVDGQANADVAHLPASVRVMQGRRAVRLTDALCPLSWPAACGVDGFVYVRGGPFCRTPICAACRAAAMRPAPGGDADIDAFLSGCTEEAAATVRASMLFARYVRWAGDTGAHPVSSTAFGRRLSARGLRKTKRNDGWHYLDLRLTP